MLHEVIHVVAHCHAAALVAVDKAKELRLRPSTVYKTLEGLDCYFSIIPDGPAGQGQLKKILKQRRNKYKAWLREHRYEFCHLEFSTAIGSRILADSVQEKEL